MLSIDHLRISLTAEMRGRETLVARLIAQELGNLPIRAEAKLGGVKLPPIVARAGESPSLLASRVSRQIHTQIQIAAAGGPSVPVPKANYA